MRDNFQSQILLNWICISLMPRREEATHHNVWDAIQYGADVAGESEKLKMWAISIGKPQCLSMERKRN